MPEIMTSEPVETGRLALAGALTIRDVPRIQARMRDALTGHHSVMIDCAAATEIDLSFIQLVLSARKSAAAAGKSVSFIPPERDVLAEVLERAGLTGPQCDDQHFWFNKVVDGDENHSDDR